MADPQLRGRAGVVVLLLVLIGAGGVGLWALGGSQAEPVSETRLPDAPQDQRASRADAPRGPVPSGDSDRDVEPSAPSVSPASRRESPAQPLVRFRVRFVGTGHAVTAGEINVAWRPVGADADRDTWLTLDARGGCSLRVARGARIERVRVEPPAATGMRFVALERELGQLAHDGMTIELEVRAGAVVAGRVVDAHDGQALAGVRVHLDDEYDEGDALTTDATGSFRRGGLVDAFDESPDQVSLRIEHPSYVPFRTVVALPAPLHANETVELRLERGVVLAGRVVDATGEPVANATVELRRREGKLGDGVYALSAHAHSSTADDGRFSCSAIPPGAAVEIRAFASAWQGVCSTIDARVDRDDIVLRLPRSTVVDIRATSEGGEVLPLSAWHLVWRDPILGWRASTSNTRVSRRFSVATGTEVEFAAWDASRLQSATRRCGRGRLVAVGDESRSTVVMRPIRVEPPEVDLTLDAASAGGAVLHLRLLDARGQPASVDSVTMRINRGSVSTWGEFTAAGKRIYLEPGSHVLAIRALGYRSRRFEFVAEPDARHSVDIPLERR